MVDDAWTPLALSVRVASVATLIIVAFGIPAALLLARGRFPGKGLLAGFLLLPLVLPPTVLGYALLQLLSRRGWLGIRLEQLFGISVVFHWSGAVVASTIVAFPLFLVPARAALESVPRELEDAARLLGRGELEVLTRITLPLAWRGLIAGAILAFARALGDFGVTLMVAGDIPGVTRTAALAIYEASTSGDFARAARLSAAVAAVAITALVLVQGTLSPRRPDGAGSP